MKLGDKDTINKFLIKISEKCKEGDCLSCPFMIEGEGAWIDCYFSKCPAGWQTQEILIGYEEFLDDAN